MPRLKPLFSEWEDKWCPQPMAKPERAELPSFQPAAGASLAAE